MLVTSGTCVVFGPLETASVIVEPSGASVFPPGSWLSTIPAASFESWSFRFTANPLAWSSELACAKGKPTTGGTPMVGGPFETLIRTFDPFTTFRPGFGACATTVFTSFAELTSWTSGFRPAEAIAAAASVADLPRTSGTTTFAGPVETKIVTAFPLSILFPAPGAWSKTKVGGCAVDGWRLISGFRPAFRIAARAADSRILV